MKARVATHMTGRFIVLICALCVWAVVASSQRLPDHVTLPAPTGPYAVGRESFDWTDPRRADPFAPETGTRRSLTGYIWYPAAAASGPPAPYVPGQILSALAAQANPAAAALARQYTVDQARVSSHAFERADLPPGSARFPILLMKPGRGGLVLQYASLAEELASQGYVVVGSDSPYTTPVVVHADGRIVVKNTQGAPPENVAGSTSELAPGQPNDLAVPVVKTWAEDNRFILDRVATLDRDRSSRFYKRLNLRAVGAFGHSMGGAAAMQFCRDDSRCRASVNIDGALWGDVAVQGLRTPALFLFSDRPMLDRDKPDNATNPLVAAIDHIRARLPNRESLIVIRGTRHYNFADAALLNDAAFARGIDMLGPIDPARGIHLTREVLRRFFDQHLRNKRKSVGLNASELRIE